VQAESDAEGAVLRFPRRTGLGRAFADITITPGPGRTYLTIPAVAETYGKVVRDFPAGTFSFTVLGGRYPALVFTDGWRVAYWLRRSVTQKQDRTLLPSDSAYQELGRRVCVAHIANLVYNS
jgi:hypothetical protein